MNVDLRVLRYDPERDSAAHWESYAVEAAPDELVIDLLGAVKYGLDGSLTFRRSCGQGICGTDAMLINGRNRLACTTRVEEVGRRVSIAPLPGLPVIKDLVVDMEGFHAGLRRVLPWPAGERSLEMGGEVSSTRSAGSRSPSRRHAESERCIACAACTSSCPAFWAGEEFIGPAAIVAAHRLIFDLPDEATEERLEVLAARDGVWRCRSIFSCVDACPRGIDVGRAVLEVRAAIVNRAM